MKWENLFSTQRIGQSALPEPSVRSEYQRDCDRLMFSAAFRRLQDKTQVFPLEKNDFVRTRLTHSLEVSCVGRSLGSSVGNFLLQKYPHLSEKNIQASDVGDIVAAACLAHDIGNPPFGHAGEQAMSEFFESTVGSEVMDYLATVSSPTEISDLRHIEGNAQGFRICNRLENPDNAGGLRLTLSTLATAAKYPSTAAQQYYKKNGFYQDDLPSYRMIFEGLKIPMVAPDSWQRHPLSFLMEAADDICYLIVDLEDAYQIQLASFEKISELLVVLAGDLIDEKRLNSMRSKSDQLAYLRAKAIGRLVKEVVDIFLEKETLLLSGDFKQPLLSIIPSASDLEALRQFAVPYIYNCKPVLEVQIAGHQVLNGLMSFFCTAIIAQCQNKESRHQRMLIELLPQRFKRYAQTPYQKILAVCDYVSGMTDSYAVALYKKLTGISLPN